MNKMELIDVMADKAGITKKDAEKALNAFIAITEETLKSGNKVQLIGFGTFETVKRAARNGINPQTKEALHVPEKKCPEIHGRGIVKEDCKVTSF